MHNFDKVTVLNYNEFYVFTPVDSNGKTYTFSPSKDGIPSQITMPFSEVEFINGQSDAFRTGTLFFKHDNPKEIYEALNIYDYDKILTNKEIEHMLLNPTIDNLQRIIDVREHSTFDRIRAIYIRLKNSDDIDLSTRVVKVMDERTEEMRLNKYNSNIILKPKNNSYYEIKEPLDESKELKEQNLTMQKEIEELRKMVAELISLNKNTIMTNENTDTEKCVENAEIVTNEANITPHIKKVGRPPKNN